MQSAWRASEPSAQGIANAVQSTTTVALDHGLSIGVTTDRSLDQIQEPTLQGLSNTTRLLDIEVRDSICQAVADLFLLANLGLLALWRPLTHGCRSRLALDFKP